MLQKTYYLNHFDHILPNSFKQMQVINYSLPKSIDEGVIIIIYLIRLKRLLLL